MFVVVSVGSRAGWDRHRQPSHRARCTSNTDTQNVINANTQKTNPYVQQHSHPALGLGEGRQTAQLILEGVGDLQGCVVIVMGKGGGVFVVIVAAGCVVIEGRCARMAARALGTIPLDSAPANSLPMQR